MSGTQQPINIAGPRHPNPEDLVLYAMQLLNTAEATTVAHHIEACADCRAELARIHGDLAAYALTVDAHQPPASSRERLLKQVAREKKIVPIAQSQTQAQTQPQVQTPPPAQPATPPPLAAFGRGSSRMTAQTQKPRTPVPLFGYAGWAVAAALAVAATFLIRDRQALRNVVATQSNQVDRLRAAALSAHQLMDALTDPRAVRVTLSAKPQPKGLPVGGVTYNPDKGSLVFIASNLTPLRLYKTYELWLIPSDGSAPIPAGTFHPDDGGNASVIMPDLPKGIPARAYGVTVEDEGGSQTPTLPIIMAGS